MSAATRQSRAPVNVRSVKGRIEDWSALLLDDKYFPYFLDFALSANDKGLGDIILFLLGADRLRFGGNGSGSMETVDVAEQYIRNHEELQSLTPRRCLDELSALRACRVPLVARLAAPCDIIWADYERRLRQVYGRGPAAAPLRKQIVSNAEMSLLSIVSSKEWKLYFEEFIDGRKDLIACYNSWNLAVACVDNIRYLRCEELPTVPETKEGKPEAITSTPSTKQPSLKENFLGLFQKSLAASPASPPPAPPEPAVARTDPRGRRSSMDSAIHRWTPASAQTNNTDYFASVGSCPDYDFTGPYEAFAFLLTAVRGIQSQLMDPTLSAAHGSGEHKPIISDATRLELQTVLTMTSSVRSAHTVESVEIDYARTCVLRLARLIHTIETETFQCLSVPFSSFLQSDHFLDLMGYIRCTQSEKTTNYFQRLLFLRQVKSLGEIHWRDSDDGSYYLKYKHGSDGTALSPRAGRQSLVPLGETPNLEVNSPTAAPAVRRAILLCRVYGDACSMCHAWKVEWLSYCRDSSSSEPVPVCTVSLSPLCAPVDSSDGAWDEFAGDMSIVKLILGSDRTGQTEPLDIEEGFIAPRFSCNSDMNLLGSYWSLVVRDYSARGSAVNVTECPNTATICKVKHSAVGSALHQPTIALMCGDGDFTASEMYSVCKSIRIEESLVGHQRIGKTVVVALESSSKDQRPLSPLSEGNDWCLLRSDRCGDSECICKISLNRTYMSKQLTRTGAETKNKLKSVLDFYRIYQPRSDWISASKMSESNRSRFLGRGSSVSSQSVSLLAVMRLIGGSANMATVVMMLLSGSSLMLLSSSLTAVAALRWALHDLVYPFPFVHIFKDLTVDSSDRDQDVVQAAAMVLAQMCAKVNFDKNRPRRQSTDEILKMSERDGTVVHPTPVLAYITHSLFQQAFAQMRKILNGKSRLSKCFVFDLDSNQFVRHGDESEEELKLMAFCCPSLSNSIQKRRDFATVQCTHEATVNLIRNIEHLQADWSSSAPDHEAHDATAASSDASVSEKEDAVSAHAPVVMLGAGPGCRRKLRRASVILQKKANIQQFDSFSSDTSNQVSREDGAAPENWTERTVNSSESLDSGAPPPVVENLFSPSPVSSLRAKKRTAITKGELLVHKNEMVMRCFQIFVAEVFLRYLPEFVVHYPGADIVSCDVQKLLDTAYTHCPVCGVEAKYAAERKAAASVTPSLDVSQDRSAHSVQNSSSLGDSSEKRSRGGSGSDQGLYSRGPLADASSPHVLFLAAVADSLSFTMLLEEHGLALAVEDDPRADMEE